MSDALKAILSQAIKEDAPNGDITTSLLISEDFTVRTSLIAKKTGVFYGEEVIVELWPLLDPSVMVSLYKKNGSPLIPNDIISDIHGSIKHILLGERVMLNLVQRLSGIATLTRRFVDALDTPAIKILDTRKTTPLFRFLEKKAVKAGGGENHRDSLSDMVLIKDNHLAHLKKHGFLKSLPQLLAHFRKSHPTIKIEVEVTSLEQIQEWDLRDADYILLDNFPIHSIEKAVQICRAKGYGSEIEVSGNITLETIPLYRKLPIQRISVGALTHSAPALDLSLEYI